MKKTNAKPETKKKPAKKPGKRADTSPAEKPAEKKGKAKRGADAAREEAVEREAPPAASAPAAPPPAPLPTPSSTATVLEDDPSRNIDGKSLHEKGKYLLNVCPKAKESPALSCISLRGQVAAATDERSCFWVDFGCAVAAAPIKVTRSSFDAFMALLDGELKAAEKLDASVVVRWDGLVATIRREGEPDGRVVLLDRFESGPEADFFFLEAPEFAVDSHATLSIERLRTAATWKGDGDAHVFVSPTARQIWIQFDAAGFTFARAVVAFDGSGLGVRQPTLPMDVSGAKHAAASIPAAPAAEPQEVEAEVIPPADVRVGVPLGLPAGLAWVRVECDRGAAWERLGRRQLELLSPFDAADEGVVSWGPWPQGAARVRFVVIYLRSQGLDPRVVPCEAASLYARALASAATAPLAELAAGGIAGELGAGGEGDAGDEPAFPTPEDGVRVVLSLSARAFADLSPDTLALLRDFRFLTFADVGGGERATGPLSPAEVAAVTAILATDGLRCAGVTPAEEGDEDSAEEWRVEAIDERDGADDLAAFPTPGERPVVFEVHEEIWRTLSTVQVRTLDELAAPAAPAEVDPWYRLGGKWRSIPLPGQVAALVGESLASWGLRCEERTDAVSDDVALERWRVGRTGERKGAAL